MELKRDDIIKVLECISAKKDVLCEGCSYRKYDGLACHRIGAKNALALIYKLTDEKYCIECSYKALKRDNERLNETCAELERSCTELTQRCTDLTRICDSYMLQYGTATDKAVLLKKERADTVRKMQKEINKTLSALCKGDVSEIHRMIDQIANELLEGEG